ncbi:hypothetical protein ABW20_dc0102809 [Dactylellina cionopaga]|nr:hypothetical protein ABW20_dc0102809 [Dactylellina cionopaga]
MKITFSNKTAYDTAFKTWPKNDDFLLIGYFPGCGAYSEGQRTFSKVHQISSSSVAMEISAVVEDLPITEAITEGEIKFGSFSTGYSSGTDKSNSAAPYYGVGVPAECLGDKENYFDVALDAKLGFSKNLPSLVSRFQEKRAMRRRRNAARLSRASSDMDQFLEKRWSIGGFLSDIGSAISSAVSSAVDTVKDAAEAAWDGITGAMKTIGEAIIDAGKVIIGTVADVDYIDTTTTWNTFLSRTTKYAKSEKIGSPWNTPWGVPGFLLAADPETETRIFCVDCGVKGNIKLNGHLVFSLKDGLKAATFTMNGTMHSNVQFGIYAEAVWETEAKVLLFDIPLGPIEVPGIFDIGPQIAVSAAASASIGMSGMITAGFTMDWNPYMKLDMMTWTSETKGWDPVLHPMVQVESEIVASVGVSLPIQIGFGVNLFKGWLLKVIAIDEKPGISFSARTAGLARADEKEKSAVIDAGLDRPNNFTCPNGVALFLDFTNTIDLEVVDVFKKNLGKARVPLWQQCLVGSSPKTSSTVDSSIAAEAELATEPNSETSITSTTDSIADSKDSENGKDSAPDSGTDSSAISGQSAPAPPAPIVRKRQGPNNMTTTAGATPFVTSSDSVGSSTYLTASAVVATYSTEINSLSSPYSTTTTRFSERAWLNSTSTSQKPSLSTSSFQETSSTVWSTTTVSGSLFPTLSLLDIVATSTTKTTASLPFTPKGNPITSLSNTTSIYTTINSTTTSTASSSSTSATFTPTQLLNFPKVIIKDAADGLFVNTNKDGTIFLCNGRCGSPGQFYTDSSAIVSDASGRVLHYYKDEIETYGVSRFRMHSVDKLPSNSVIVGLFEFKPNKIVAVSTDPTESWLAPVACRIEGAPTKFFLVKDLNGIKVLKSPGFPLVGGKVIDCSVKNLTMVKV